MTEDKRAAARGPHHADRTVGVEDRVADRIAELREMRGWTFETVARKMTVAGCNISPASVFKIEKGEPRRRKVTVDELVGFARAFNVEWSELMAPVGGWEQFRYRERIAALPSLLERQEAAAHKYKRTCHQVALAVETSPELAEDFQRHLEAVRAFDDDPAGPSLSRRAMEDVQAERHWARQDGQLPADLDAEEWDRG